MGERLCATEINFQNFLVYNVRKYSYEEYNSKTIQLLSTSKVKIAYIVA